MAINLTYDPSDDPQAIEAQEAVDAESLAIGEQLQQEQDALLAGKYKSAEELEQAYIELQKKLGSREQNQQEPEDGAEEGPVEDDTEEDPTETLLFNIGEELEQTGQISEESLAALENYSSKDIVETYMRLRNDQPTNTEPASVELTPQQVSEIQNYVGGEQAYQQLVGWAAENFSPAEVEAFDSVIDSGNVGAISLALQALYYRYTDSVGYEGDMLQGKPAARSTDVFRSQAEVVRAMSDPRYDNDPAYRQDIFDKLERSDINF